MNAATNATVDAILQTKPAGIPDIMQFLDGANHRLVVTRTLKATPAKTICKVYPVRDRGVKLATGQTIEELHAAWHGLPGRVQMPTISTVAWYTKSCLAFTSTDPDT